MDALDLTLVIDIGKSNAKLLLFDADGAVLEQHSRANASVTAALGYPALDVQGLAQWMQTTLRGCANARRCGHVIASTHGAAPALVAAKHPPRCLAPHALPDAVCPVLGLAAQRRGQQRTVCAGLPQPP